MEVALTSTQLDPNDYATPANMKLVEALLYKRFPVLIDNDDLTSYIYFGIRKAIETYDPSAGTAIMTWLGRKALWEVIDQLRQDGLYWRADRKSENHHRHVFVGAAFAEWPDEYVPWFVNKSTEEIDNVDVYEFLLEQLSPKEQFIMRQRYEEKKTFAETGMLFDQPVTRSRISQLYGVILKKLEVFRDEAGLYEFTKEEYEKWKGKKKVRQLVTG